MIFLFVIVVLCIFHFHSFIHYFLFLFFIVAFSVWDTEEFLQEHSGPTEEEKMGTAEDFTRKMRGEKASDATGADGPADGDAMDVEPPAKKARPDANPLVFFDMKIGAMSAGRIVMEVPRKTKPR